MLFVCFSGNICNNHTGFHVFNPLHLSGVVGFERAVINLAKTLMAKSTNDTSYNKIRDQTLCCTVLDEIGGAL
jgi:hypothetical protein